MPSNGFMNILLLGIELGRVVQGYHGHQGDHSSARTHTEESSVQAENNVQGAKYFYQNNVTNHQGLSSYESLLPVCRCTFCFLFVNASMPKVGGLRSSKHIIFVLRVYRSLWAASSSVMDDVRDALLCL